MVKHQVGKDKITKKYFQEQFLKTQRVDAIRLSVQYNKRMNRMEKNRKKNITRFIYMGDPQCTRLGNQESGYHEWGSLLRAAREHKISESFNGPSERTSDRQTPDRIPLQAADHNGEYEMMILGGDIVNRGDKETEWQDFLTELNESGRGLAVATPVTGSKASTGRHSRFFTNPGNGPMGHEKDFFSFDYGCCHFIVLDSAYMGNRNRDAYKYIGQWIKADLAANMRPVTIAVMHHPMFTIGDSADDDIRASAMRENYLKLLHKYGVDFILCGHQHAYSRTPEIKEEGFDGGLVQIMGVSGTKFFDVEYQGAMEFCIDHVPVATVFETDGEFIVMETINGEGEVIDRIKRQVRKTKPGDCTACRNFAECRGTGEYEKVTAAAKAGNPGDPLKPCNENGIMIKCGETQGSDIITDEQIRTLKTKEIIYSVRYKDGIHYENINGFMLEDLLEASGCREINLNYGNLNNYVLIITSGDGTQRAMVLSDVLWAGCYGADDDHKLKNMVPAVIFEEGGGYRLAFGQKSPMHFNSRMWARNIREIEVTPFDT